MKKITILLLLAWPLILVAQTPQVQKVFYEGTNNLQYEYEYIVGKQANITNVVERDSRTKELQSIDTRNHGISEVLKHGFYKEYYMNGTLKQELTYIEGKKQGKGTSYYESSKLQATYTFNHNVLNGAFVYYYENGQKMDECQYENGKRDGEGYLYNDDGTISLKLEYIPSDKLNYETDFSYANAKSYQSDNTTLALQGRMKIIYPATSAYSIQNFNYYFDGEWKRYDENGKLQSIESYVDDIMVGEVTNFYPNGNKKEVLNCIKVTINNIDQSVVDGNYAFYDENGKLTTKGFLRTYMEKDSTLKTKRSFIWRWYDENEKPEVYIYYNADEVKKRMEQPAIEQEENLNFDLPFDELKKIVLSKYGKNYYFHFEESLMPFLNCQQSISECNDRKDFYTQTDQILGLIYNEMEKSTKVEEFKKWINYADKVYSKMKEYAEKSADFNFVGSQIKQAPTIGRKLDALNIENELYDQYKPNPNAW